MTHSGYQAYFTFAHSGTIVFFVIGLVLSVYFITDYLLDRDRKSYVELKKERK